MLKPDLTMLRKRTPTEPDPDPEPEPESDPDPDPDPELRCGASDVKPDLTMLKKIVIGWVVTIPAAATVSLFLFFFLKGIFGV